MVTRMRKCPPVPVAPSTFFQRKKNTFWLNNPFSCFFFNLKKKSKKNALTFGVGLRLRGLPVHGPLHGFLPAGEPRLALC